MRSTTTSPGSGSDPQVRVRSLFEAALACAGDSRDRILDEAARTDPDVAAEVRSLLCHHDEGSSLLDHGIGPAAQRLGVNPPGAFPDLDVPPPDRVGKFHVVRELGRGGMGVVYEATQEFPARHVALKVIRPDLVTTPTLRRFQHEAEVLALLQHPGIAQIYEAGYADGAQRTPYIVMELVEGRSLREHASTLSSHRDVLSLIALVADAVEHAHRRGVIHRDLKPANILITPGGAPKILDFGISRLTEADASFTMATQAGQVLGTLGYMSPEQIEADPRMIDVRCDVYALSVILYELLAGELPFKFQGLSLAESTVAARSREAPLLGRVRPALRGDVEAIVAKGLEKDLARRYQSVGELSADIRRYLAHEPVLARRQTAWYHALRFAQRNRLLVGAVGVGVLALCAGIAGTSWQALRATRQTALAHAQADRARQTADFLKRIFQSVTPEVSQGREITVRQLLDAASLDLADNPPANALAAAETHATIADAYLSLTDYATAEQHAREAQRLFDESLGADSRDGLLALNTRLLAMANLGRGNEALPLAARSLDTSTRKFGPDAPVTLELEHIDAAMNLYTRPPDFATGVQKLERAAAHCRAALGDDDLHTVNALQSLARAYVMSNRPTDARPLLARVVDYRRSHQGPEHPRTLAAVMMLAGTCNALGDYAALVTQLEQPFQAARRVLGDEHLVTGIMASELSDAYEHLGRAPEATALRRLSYATTLKRQGADAVATIVARHQLAENLLDQSLCDEAAPLVHAEFEYSKRADGAHLGAMASYLEFRLAYCAHDEGAMAQWLHRIEGTEFETQARAMTTSAK